MEATLAEDLGADSLDAVELNIALEEQLGLSIADEDRPKHEDCGRHRPLSGGQGGLISTREVTVPMDLESIYALMERFERSSLTGLELEQNGTRLKLDRTVTAAPAAAAPIPAAAPVLSAPPAPTLSGERG